MYFVYCFIILPEKCTLFGKEDSIFVSVQWNIILEFSFLIEVWYWHRTSTVVLYTRVEKMIIEMINSTLSWVIPFWDLTKRLSSLTLPDSWSFRHAVITWSSSYRFDRVLKVKTSSGLSADQATTKNELKCRLWIRKQLLEL